MTIRNDNLGGTDWTYGEKLKSEDLNDTFDANNGLLGEIRQFAISISGSLTKSQLQSRGWAICDGTTPASQGISGATITTTPDLQHKFIRMSDDETSGNTGGSEINAHTHSVTLSSVSPSYSSGSESQVPAKTQTYTTSSPSDTNNLPPYYELVFFIKVKY